MIKKTDYASVQKQLQGFLEARILDVQVQIGDNIHYAGTNVVVTSPAFIGLLPEQRFHQVVRAIPKEFYELHFRGGIVWFELAPGESGMDYMKSPRSEDVAEQEPVIVEQLAKIRFVDSFRSKVGKDSSLLSTDDLNTTREVLGEAGLSEQEITRACLFFIRHGGFCDVQVLADVIPEMTKEHAA